MEVNWKDGRIVEVWDNKIGSKYDFLNTKVLFNVNWDDRVMLYNNYDLRYLMSIYGLLPGFVKKEMLRIGVENFACCIGNVWKTRQLDSAFFKNDSCYHLRSDYTVKLKETIRIGENVYDKEEVEQRLSGLKAIKD